MRTLGLSGSFGSATLGSSTTRRFSASRRFSATLGVSVTLGLLVACSPQTELPQAPPRELAFSEAQALEVTRDANRWILVGDVSKDGWSDVLTLRPGRAPQVALAVPHAGLAVATNVDGLPSTPARQAQLLDINGDERADVLWLDESGRLRRFDSLSATEFEEVSMPVVEEEQLAFAFAELNQDDWLDLITVSVSRASSEPDGDGGAVVPELVDGGSFPNAALFDAAVFDAAVSDAAGPDAARPDAPGSDGRGAWSLSVRLGTSAGWGDSADAWISEEIERSDAVERAFLHAADVDLDGDVDVALVLPGWGGAVVINAGAPPTVDAGDTSASGALSLDLLVVDALDDASGATGFVLSDRDADGDVDWFQFSEGGDVLVLDNDGGFEIAGNIRGIGAGRMGCAEDFTNDGRLDLLVETDAQFALYQARAGSDDRYDRATAPGDDVGSLTSLVCSDVNKDGDIDVIAAGEHGVALFVNQLDPLLGDDAHFFGFRLQGKRGNSPAIGTRVELTAEKRVWSKQYTATSQGGMTGSPALHFGLGSAEFTDEVRVLWPDGEVQLADERWAVDDIAVMTQP